MKIDLNSDLGEGFGRWKSGDDEALMPVITSANIACGYHAGDAVIMARTVEIARANGVDIGAHVGLPDLLGFGRVAMDIDPRDFRKHVLYQLGALAAIAQVGGGRVTHAGGHGALDAMSRRNPEYADALLESFAAFDRGLIVRHMANASGDRARALGLRSVGLIFADRGYDDDGNLASRKLPGALLTDPEAVARRMEQFLHDGTITTLSGKRIRLQAQSVLVHSDTPGAVEIARTVRRTVEAGGGQIVPITEIAG